MEIYTMELISIGTMVEDMLIFVCLPRFTNNSPTTGRYNAPKQSQHCPYESLTVQYCRKWQEMPVEVESKRHALSSFLITCTQTLTPLYTISLPT